MASEKRFTFMRGSPLLDAAGARRLITVPVFLPLVVGYGYDPAWFAVIVVIVELGLIHPPVGMNPFVIQAQAPDLKLSVYLGVLPFLLAPLILIRRAYFQRPASR